MSTTVPETIALLVTIFRNVKAHQINTINISSDQVGFEGKFRSSAYHSVLFSLHDRASKNAFVAIKTLFQIYTCTFYDKPFTSFFSANVNGKMSGKLELFRPVKFLDYLLLKTPFRTWQ